MTRIGWFSEEAKSKFGSVIYSDLDGNEVEITGLTHTNMSDVKYNWADKICVGPVKEYLRGSLNPTSHLKNWHTLSPSIQEEWYF